MTCAADFHSAFSRGIFSLSLFTHSCPRDCEKVNRKKYFFTWSRLLSFFSSVSTRFYGLLSFIQNMCVLNSMIMHSSFLISWNCERALNIISHIKSFFIFLKSFINKLYDEVINFQNGSTKKKLSRWCSFAE